MLMLYGFALLVGGGLFVLSLFDADDIGDGLADGADAMDGNAIQWLSLRSVMYFAFVFGGVGVALTWTWPGATAPLIAILSTVAGLAIGSLVTAAFRYLKQTESGYRTGDDSFAGVTGRITLPFGESGTGKVLVTRGDRTFELLARPFGADATRPKLGDTVVVVEISRGIALVTSLDSSTSALTSPDQ